MGKLGRNQPCHCGSGKKYKKCHLRQDEEAELHVEMNPSGVPAALWDQVAAAEAEQRALEAQGYYLPHIEAEFKGKRIRGVKNTIFVRPLTETFHEFLLGLLRHTLTEAWFRAEQAKPQAKRHFIVLCWERFVAWKQRTVVEGNREGETWGATPDGWTKSLFALAVDVYSLLHRGELPPRLVNRLRHRDQYQGARYEIAVAGMFIRVGCTVHFLDRSTSDAVATHCEFIATHNATGVEIAVEAKSRHRPGVLHMPGTAHADPLMRANVKDLLERAVSQAPAGKPFIIFVDVNVPIDPALAGTMVPWMTEVQGVAQQNVESSIGGVTDWNGAVFTNYSYHYATEREAEILQVVALPAPSPRVALPDRRFFGYLESALRHYGGVPDLT